MFAIEKLSGGLRKRTSVALELLTRPTLLFLDEPATGLDPGLDKSVMQTLRGLADDEPGRTVVVVTHNVAHLDKCDRLLQLAPPPTDPGTGQPRPTGGQMAFFGPPREALAYFGVSEYADLFVTLAEHSEVDWGARFRQSPLWARYVAQDPPRAARRVPTRPGHHAAVPRPGPSSRR